jgi:parvulin-like peptidyl-prolyl isomerase
MYFHLTRAGAMNKSKVWRTSLATASLTLAGVLAGTIYAQTEKATSQNPAPAPASATAPAKVTPPEKVVMKVGDKQVTAADLDNMVSGFNPQAQRVMAVQGRRAFAEQYSMMLLLSQQAVRDHLDSSPAFQRQMEFDRMQWLARTELESIRRQVQVTPEEVSEYFKAHQAEFDEVKLRQTVIRRRPEGAKEGTPGLAPEEARKTVEAFRSALAAGKDTKQLAQDLKVANAVRLDTEPRPFRRGQLPAAWEKVAFALKDGEVSEPLDSGQAIVLLQSAGQRHAELKDVSPQIENQLRQQKVQAAIDDLKKKNPIWMDQEYFAPPAAPVPPTAPQPPLGTPPVPRAPANVPPAGQTPPSNPPPKS